jgi:dihydrofolate synthase / folylpolyglutamate synthase
VKTPRRDWGPMPLGLFGEHQGGNAAAAVVAVECLGEAGLPVSDRAVRDGLRTAQWPARMELLSRRPVVVLDCAHNVASARALAAALLRCFPVVGRRHLIFAASADKQIREMLELMARVIDHFHLTRYRSNPRSADPVAVANILRELGKDDIEIHEGPEVAWRTAWARSGPDDGIVVAGSVFLAGELRPTMLRDCRS